MGEPLKASDGSLFLQLTPGEAPEYIGCVDAGALPDPRGAISLLRCRDLSGGFQTVGETQGVPDLVTTTITAWIYPEADILDRLSDKKCRANLYLMLNDCGKRGRFADWARADLLYKARLTNVTGNNFVMREAADPATRALELTGWGVYHLRNKVSIKRQAIAETTSLFSIALDTDTLCAGNCGQDKELCESGFVGGQAPAGSPTSLADIWHTEDAGATWTNTRGGSAQPFGAGYDIRSAALFAIDRTTSRWLVAREIVAGLPMQVAYSDDGGDTWTRVTVGATNGEGAAAAKILFALDRDHIWLATNLGNIYFSDDGGLTWDDQAGALAASAGAQLNAIKFIDSANGYAVGENGAILRTDDGGESWEVLSDPTSGADIKSVAVFTPYRALIGTNTDKLYHTKNSGDSWTAKTFTGQGTAGTVVSLQNVGEEIVWMAHNPLSGQGYIHRSIDGGHSWERYATPANAGLNDLAVCDANHAWVVGNAYAGTGFVAKISS